MARLRGKTAKGRGGAVQCSKEGCKFGPKQIVRCAGLDGETSPSDCFLQLRLRAGDAEDAIDVSDLKQHIFEETDRMWREECDRTILAGDVKLISWGPDVHGMGEPDIALAPFERDVLDGLNARLDGIVSGWDEPEFPSYANLGDGN